MKGMCQKFSQFCIYLILYSVWSPVWRNRSKCRFNLNIYHTCSYHHSHCPFQNQGHRVPYEDGKVNKFAHNCLGKECYLSLYYMNSTKIYSVLFVRKNALWVISEHQMKNCKIPSEQVFFYVYDLSSLPQQPNEHCFRV